MNGAKHTIAAKAAMAGVGFFFILNDTARVGVANLTVANASIAVFGSQNITLDHVSESNGSWSLTQDAFHVGLAETTDGGILVLSSQNFTIQDTKIAVWGGHATATYSPYQPPYFVYDGYTPPAAVAIEYSEHGLVRNTSLRANGTGVFLIGAQNVTLRNNSIDSPAPGVLCAGLGCTRSQYGILGENLIGFSEFSDALRLPRQALIGVASSDIAILNATGVSLQNSTLNASAVIGVSLQQVTVGTIAYEREPVVEGIGVQLLNDVQVSVFSNALTCGPTGPAGTFGVSSFGSSGVAIENNTVLNSSVDAVSLQEDNGDLVAFNNLFPGYPIRGNGIQILNVTRSVVRNNSMGGWEGNQSVAINATGLTESRIVDNILSYSTTGIRLVDSFDVHVLGNYLLGGANTPTGAELRLIDSASLTIAGNQLQGGRIGILADGGGLTAISGNNFSVSLGTAIHWSSFDTVSITGNDLSDDALAVYLAAGAHYNITGNDLSIPIPTFASSGIQLYHVSDGIVSGNNLSTANVGVGGNDLVNLTISDNTCYDAGFGVLVGIATNLTVVRNVGSNLLEGVEVDSSVHAKIVDNSFRDTISEGIGLIQSTNAFVEGNLLAHAQAVGISLDAATSPTLLNNTVTLANTALDVENATGVTVTGNTLAGSNTSLLLRFVYGATFVHNNFETDLGWTIDHGTDGLRWDGGYPVGGNYWSNDTGADRFRGPGQNQSGADGILDVPFAIPGNGFDRYPLSTGWAAPSVTFVVSGLPLNTLWSAILTFGGWGVGSTSVSSQGLTVTVAVPFAAYTPFSYRVPSLPGFVPNSPRGNGTTTAGNVDVPLFFHAYTFSLDFHETGLASGLGWSVVLDGVLVTGSQSWLNLSRPNGTYGYTIPPIAGYYVLPPGSARIAGTNAVVTVPFTPVLYSVQFVEFGLPNGTVWQVNVSGLQYSVTGTVLEFHLGNGSYVFSVGKVAGFTVSPGNGSISVVGFDRAIRIAFGATPVVVPPPRPAGPPLLEYALATIAGILAILAGVGWALAIRRGRASSGPEEGPDTHGADGVDEEGPSGQTPVDMERLTEEAPPDAPDGPAPPEG